MASESVPFPSLLPRQAPAPPSTSRTAPLHSLSSSLPPPNSSAPFSSFSSSSSSTATTTTAAVTASRSAALLPCTSSSSSSSSSSPWQWIMTRLGRWLSKDTAVWWQRAARRHGGDTATRRVALYSVCVLVYMATQLLVGAATLNTGVISEALYTAFDGMVLALCLVCMLVSRQPPSAAFSYGYARFEVFAGFAIACFLLFLALFALVDGVHAYFAAFDHSHFLLWFAMPGFVVNAAGLFLFGSSCSLPKPAGSSRVGNGGRDLILHAIFLYIFCDFFGRIMLVLQHSVPLFNAAILRLLITLSASGFTLYLTVPLLRSTGMILLQTRPVHLAEPLRRAIRDISAFDGVLECRSRRWWSHVPGHTCGTLHVRVRADADEQAVLLYAHEVLANVLHEVCVQIEKDSSMEWILNAPNAAM